MQQGPHATRRGCGAVSKVKRNQRRDGGHDLTSIPQSRRLPMIRQGPDNYRFADSIPRSAMFGYNNAFSKPNR